MNGDNSDCPMYKKHHNIIDGIYMLRLPDTWDEIPYMDEFDALDEEGQLQNLLIDANFYDIEDLTDFINPPDKHNIGETIFVIRRDGEYFLCETQGENYIKFSTNISKVEYIKNLDRTVKLKKIQDRIQ